MNWYRGVYTCGEPPRDQGYDLLYLQPVLATWLNTRIEYWLLFWVLSTGQIQFLWVMERGWQDIQVNQNTPHLFIRRNICLEISFYKEPLQVSGELTEDIEVYQSTPTYLHNPMTSDILRVLSEVLRELNGTSDFIAPRLHPMSPPDLFINQCPSSNNH